LNIIIKVVNLKGEIVGSKMIRYAVLKEVRQLTIPFGDYTLILEVR